MSLQWSVIVIPPSSPRIINNFLHFFQTNTNTSNNNNGNQDGQQNKLTAIPQQLRQSVKGAHTAITMRPSDVHNSNNNYCVLTADNQLQQQQSSSPSQPKTSQSFPELAMVVSTIKSAPPLSIMKSAAASNNINNNNNSKGSKVSSGSANVEAFGEPLSGTPPKRSAALVSRCVQQMSTEGWVG